MTSQTPAEDLAPFTEILDAFLLEYRALHADAKGWGVDVADLEARYLKAADLEAEHDELRATRVSALCELESWLSQLKTIRAQAWLALRDESEGG